MTTVSQIITDAYQYNNIVAITVIPSAAEQAKALRYLNRIFKNVFGNELGDKLNSLVVGTGSLFNPDRLDEASLITPYAVPANSRLVCKLLGPQTIYLPVNPDAGSRFSIQDVGNNFATYPLTLNGNGRLIELATSLVINTNGSNIDWFFRDDLASWVRVSDLVLTAEFPLPTEFEEYFITMLAMRLGASEDIELNNQLQFVLKDMMKKFRSRYRQTVEVGPEQGLIRMTNATSLGNRTGGFSYG
jgi:hypothetical protein